MAKQPPWIKITLKQQQQNQKPKQKTNSTPAELSNASLSWCDGLSNKRISTRLELNKMLPQTPPECDVRFSNQKHNLEKIHSFKILSAVDIPWRLLLAQTAVPHMLMQHSSPSCAFSHFVFCFFPQRFRIVLML